MPSVTHRPVSVLLVVAALIAGCGPSDLSPSASGPAAPTASTEALEPTATPSQSPTLTPAPADPLLGQVVVTVSDGLRVRSQPRVSDDSVKYEPLLPLGTELQVIDGPVNASGYVWYKVTPVSFSLRDGPGNGWVAMAGKDGEAWIAVSGGPLATPGPTASPTAGGHIVGLVTGVDGSPLGGVSVQALRDTGDYVTTTTASGATNGLNYDLGPLPAADYRISFFDPSRRYAVAYYVTGASSPSYRLVTRVPVADATVTRIDMRLPLANRIFGTVTGNGGIPLAGVDVLAWSIDGCVLPAGCLRDKTAADGSFTVRGLAYGEYTLRLSYPDMGAPHYYAATGDTSDPSMATQIAIAGWDVPVDVVIPVDADSCGRPMDRYHDWLMTRSPYRCANGSLRREAFGGQELTSVVDAGPGYVALGLREFTIGQTPQAAAFTSSDGITWSAVEVDSRISGRLTSGAGWIVAVGPGTGGRSADGITWQRATQPPRSTATVVAVTTAGRTYVAIGQRSARGGHAAVWTSRDGLRWTQVPDQAALDRFCASAITGGPAGLVAVGSDCHSPNAASAVVIRSTDGLHWRRVPSQSAFSENAALTSVIRGNPADGEPAYLALGYHRPTGGRMRAAIWTSPDGAKWRQVLTYSGFVGWLVATVSGYRAVGSPGSRSWDSPDGKSWRVRLDAPLPGNPTGNQAWSPLDAASNGSTVVVVGAYEWLDGAPRTEYGGLVWQQTP